MSTFHDRLYEALHDTESASYQRVEAVVYGLIVVSIALFAQELIGGRAGPLGVILDGIDLAILVVFGVEVALRVLLWRPATLGFYDLSPGQRFYHHVVGRFWYVLTPMIIIDLLTVLAVVPLFRGLRALRLLRLFNKRARRANNPFLGIVTAVEENALAYGFGMSIFGVAVLVGGLSLYLVEREENPALNSISDGIWWAIVTLTTVGFGDIAPVTSMGRVVGGVLMVGGMVTLALFAGIVGQTLMQSVLIIREEQFRMQRIVNHVVVCGYEAGNHMILDALSHEIDTAAQTVVVFAPGDRPKDLPPEFKWISGNATKESELEKARMRYAETVIIAGSRTVLPEQADATTILTAFTVRRHLEQRPLDTPRQRPLYIVAEVLDVENLEHARAAGVDEVIETTRVGFSMVAHAVRHPGMAKVMSSLAAPTGQSLFVGRVPAGIALPASWAEVTQALHSHSVLAIGLRDGDSGHDRIQPDPNTQVGTADQVIYLATSQVLPAA